MGCLIHPGAFRTFHLLPKPTNIMTRIVQEARKDLSSYLFMGSLVLCTFLV